MMISMSWMISLFSNRLVINEDGDYSFKKISSSSSSSSLLMGVGLQILIKSHQDSSKTVLHNSLKPRNRQQAFSCFLNSCFLCNKNLSPHEDVYMYKGDQGFCSEECRNRQIYLDEMKEIVTYTKQILASFRQSQINGARCHPSVALGHHRPTNRPVIFS